MNSFRRKKTVLLVDDHELFRVGLRLILQPKIDANIIEAGKISDITSFDSKVDVILLDICLPGLNGIDGMSILLKRWPDARVVLLSALSHHDEINKALAAGAHCFLNKDSAPHVICDTVISLLVKGRLPKLQPDHHLAAPVQSSKAMLSNRLLGILDLISEGASNKAIASQLGLSENTVRNHTASLMAHFNVHSRAQIIIAAQRAGYLSK